MRIITMLTGILFIFGGVYLVANGGVTFLSVAFLVGTLFVIAGIIECLSYTGFRGAGEDKAWVMIDGMTTFALGMLILLDKISAENAVPQILGLWVLISGIRNFVRAWEHIENRSSFFYDHLSVGMLNFVTGLYVFFNGDIFGFSSIMLVGLCVVVQGINIVNVGMTIVIVKPEFIKTKEEKVEDASKAAENAHEAAREAIKAAKAAQAQLKNVVETPEEELDKTLAPKPTEVSEKK